MKAAFLHVLKDGTVRGLYTEAIHLGSLGHLQIERAATIEFDQPAQLWNVLNREGQCLYSSSSRQDCLDWEAEYLNRREDAR
jgi:hypothetical protein